MSLECYACDMTWYVTYAMPNGAFFKYHTQAQLHSSARLQTKQEEYRFGAYLIFPIKELPYIDMLDMQNIAL